MHIKVYISSRQQCSGYTLHENTYLTDNEYMYSYCLEMDSFVNHGML